MTTPPIAYGPNSATIVGPGYEYIVTNGATYTLTYPAASGSQGAPDAVLTHRVHLDDVPQVVPTSGWQYTDATNTAIKLTSGSFVNNDIYEFTYIAKNPTVNGIGFAAIRDFMSWLRYATDDGHGTPNPLANYIQRVYTDVVSQPARTLNDFTYLGFNQDLNGHKVFDGMLQWVGAADGISMNYRWSQPSRTERNRQELLFQEGVFPFADVSTYDPISQTTDWRFKRCEQTNTCPLMMEMWSANEYWVKAASLFHTDPTGTFDLPDHPLTRKYFLSSSQHAGPGNPTTKGACQQFLNPLDPQQVERALWVALDQWSTKGIAPPESQIPTLASGLLVPPIPQSGMGFPNIPNVTYTGLKTTRYRYNYGPNFYQTLVPTFNPPLVSPPFEDNSANGPIYPSYIPKTDSDGNDIGGIRLPELTVPLATYTGWALRSGAWANDGCEGSGQYIPFAATAAARGADPRPSVQERYVTYAAYQSQVVAAVNTLVEQRFFNCDDTQPTVVRLLAAGLAAGVPANLGNLQPPNPIPACAGHPTHDLNGDGVSDIVLADGSGNFALWLMNGGTVLASQPIGNLAAWSLVGQRDFNGDGNADLLWRDASGNLAMWFMEGGAVLSSAGLGNVPTSWSIYGTGDMNGDGIGDILWRDSSRQPRRLVHERNGGGVDGEPRQRADELDHRRDRRQGQHLLEGRQQQLFDLARERIPDHHRLARQRAEQLDAGGCRRLQRRRFDRHPVARRHRRRRSHLVPQGHGGRLVGRILRRVGNLPDRPDRRLQRRRQDRHPVDRRQRPFLGLVHGGLIGRVDGIRRYRRRLDGAVPERRVATRAGARCPGPRSSDVDPWTRAMPSRATFRKRRVSGPPRHRRGFCLPDLATALGDRTSGTPGSQPAPHLSCA